MIKKSFGGALTSTSTTYYTVPNGKKAEWTLLYIMNTSGSNETVSVDFYDASTDSTLPILDSFQISSKDFLRLGGGTTDFIMLDEGDQIKADSNHACSILISVIEYNDIIQGG
jgi:hypothetical protein